MARNFLAYPFAPYKGIYSSEAFNSQRGQKGLMVALDLLWAIYDVGGSPLGSANPNFAVSFNLNIAGPNSVAAQWYIQSVYIDNEGVDFPVYVYFLDTQFTVSCPPNSAGWYQVFTNGRQGIISAVGMTDTVVSQAQRTRLFFTDSVMVPSLDQELQSNLDIWLGSTSLHRTNGNFSGYASPVLGDNVIALPFSITGAQTNVSPLSGNPQNLFITQIQMSCAELINTSGADASASFGLFNNVNIGYIAGGSIDLRVGRYYGGMLLDVRGNLPFLPNLNWFLLGQFTQGSQIQGSINTQIVYSLH